MYHVHVLMAVCINMLYKVMKHSAPIRSSAPLAHWLVGRAQPLDLQNPDTLKISPKVFLNKVLLLTKITTYYNYGLNRK